MACCLYYMLELSTLGMREYRQMQSAEGVFRVPALEADIALFRQPPDSMDWTIFADDNLMKDHCFTILRDHSLLGP